MLNTLKQKGTVRKGQTGEGEDASLPQVKTWYQDRYQIIVIQRNVLFIITVLAMFGLGFAVTAVAMLNASKTFEPFVIEVEDKTGIVVQVDQKTVERYTADESVTRYFLVKYLRARETYNFADFQYFYYEIVRLLSSTEAYSEFVSSLAVSNTDSPINLGRENMLKVDVKSVSFLGPKKAQVRFAVKKFIEVTRGGKLDGEQHYIATINYDFLSLDLSPEDRYINPIGFQVTSYRRDKETL